MYAVAVLMSFWRAEPILDDTAGILNHTGSIADEWLKPSYGAAGGVSGWAWGPLPGTLQGLVALAFGRETVLPFRALNFALHLTNAALVGLLAQRRGLPAGVGMLALLHPIGLQPALWASCTFDTLGGTVLLLGLLSPLGPLSVAITTLALGLCKPALVAAGLVLLLVSQRGLGATAGFLVGATAYTALYLSRAPQSVDDVLAMVTLPDRLFAWLGMLPYAWAWPGAGMSAMTARSFGDSWPGLAVLVGVVWKPMRSPIAAYALTLLLPAMVPAAGLGLAPTRYAYVPLLAGLALLPAFDLRRFHARLSGKGGLLLCGFAAVLLPGTLRGASGFTNPYSLFASEAGREPDNPVAQAWFAQVHHRTSPSAHALATWDGAMMRFPTHVRVPDATLMNTDLAKACFLARQAGCALAASQRATARTPTHREAWCVYADTLDALGRNDEAAAIDGRCR